MNRTFFFHTDRLTVGYDKKPLIRDIEIGIDRGQILTLIGPNGSGKSTILKSITKQLKALGGTVWIGGCPVEQMTERDLSRRASVVLTERLKTELMTCEDVVASGRYPYTGTLGILSAFDRSRVCEAMALVNVLDLKDRDFTRISDGQRQRVLLARAICQETEIIVLDEPTSFLDAHHALELLGLLRRLAKERNLAVIMSLHELGLAQKVSDQVLCVKGEYLTHWGPPSEIFRPELICELYGLPLGSYNPLFGSLELARPAGEPKVFVIAGGGTGIGEYRALQRQGIPFISGVLHENDVDYQVASALAAAVIGEQSFLPIGDEAYGAALRAMEDCDTVVNCLQSYGEINVRNKALFEAAKAMGLRTADRAAEVRT